MRADFTTATNQAKALRHSDPIYKSVRPVHFKALLQALDLKLERAKEGQDEALLDPQKKIIFILEDDKPLSRKYFSIAHEIGHWVLHSRDKIRSRAICYEQLDPISKIEEQEANAFAAELLMPYDEVAACIFWGYEITHLQEYFNVSYEFATYRYNFVSAMGLY
ncbi:ImmA/IrrE family metallo-endopeptidase [Helicobacter sp. L8]|uniref:ImmA/IrrE family metallo-endopeptidase n=1 Tax=Helicobacter sp. L8 TaxID=2316078 RepID=UPI000EB5C969|nr:ImmA/IrrE family metallo-endopeptidase [Helicobacter sp. L8]